MSVTGLAGMYNIKKLTPYLVPPKEIFAGKPALFRLGVRNNKRYLPSFLIKLQFQSGQSVFFPIITKNSSCDGGVILTFNHRGVIPVGQLTVSSTYPVGFFTRYWKYESDALLTVFPALIASRHIEPCGESQWSGTALRREHGNEGELERIYPYSGIEPLRAIHWKLSARSIDLMIKSFGGQSASPLFIDLASMTGRGLEERVSRAAWFVRSLVRERPVGLVLGKRIIPAECGKQHGLKLLKELALYGRD